MEIKEAVKWFEEELKDGKCSDECVQCNANEKALEALRKQIPIKPKKLTYKLLLEDGWIYKCPTCGCACGENKFHPDVTKDDIYCTQCGQALDLS